MEKIGKKEVKAGTKIEAYRLIVWIIHESYFVKGHCSSGRVSSALGYCVVSGNFVGKPEKTVAGFMEPTLGPEP